MYFIFYFDRILAVIKPMIYKKTDVISAKTMT